MKRTFALLAALVLLAGLLLASLLLVASNAPVRADEPEPPPLIPRHRVGHRAKVQNLDTIVAEGGDPLAGNHRLVADDEIFLILRPTSGPMAWQYSDVDSSLDSPELIETVYSDGANPALATGNFNGDHLDDFVGVRTYGSELYMKLGYFKDGLQEVTYDFDTGEQTGVPPRVATGDFDGDGQDEIVMAWQDSDKRVNLKVYDPQGSIHPAAKGKLYDEKVTWGTNLGVATGDFDGDGTDEVVLAWHGLDLHLNVKVYDVDHDGNLIAKAKWTGGEGLQTAAVATGDFNGDGIDEITVLDSARLGILQVTGDDLDTLTLKSEHVYGFNDCLGVLDFYFAYGQGLDVATGDFDADGQDEVVAACYGLYRISVHVWALDSNLGLAPKALWTKTIDNAGQVSIAVGDLNHDLRSEIVLLWNEYYGLYQHNYLQIFQVATDLGSMAAKGQQDLGRALANSKIALALGDLDGDSVQVGPPTYSRVTEAKQLLATINEPPKHLDTIDGTEYDINVSETGMCTVDIGPPCTFARYGTETTTSTTMTLSTSRDWGFSSELGAGVGPIDASLKLSYGEGFEKTTSSLHEVSFGQDSDAGDDDVIIRTETDYDVWEYPVYSDTTGTIQGYIAVVFPVKQDPDCTKDCTVDSKLATIDGKNPLALLYVPNHENHNMLSYSPVQPTDVITPIKTSSRIYLGANPSAFTVKWTDVRDDEEKKTRKQEVEFGAGVEEWGIKAKVDGTYSKDQVSTHKVSFETETSIYLRFNNIEEEYSYVVDPYVYWSSDGGHLAVDYAVRPLIASPETWWQTTYDKPDPAFNLPWKDGSEGDDYKLLSKEITFQPYSPRAGELVTVTAKVRNYSVSSDNDVTDVTVRLYLGDPDDGGQQIGSDQTIPELKVQSSQTETVQFDTTGYGGQTLNVYAVVDPDKQIEEMHDETNLPNNNKAYAILPVKMAAVPGRPVNLAIAPEDIVLNPEIPTAGETVHISATIQAQGDAFTHVGVEFWDGDPYRGGRYIGGDYIPMILAGETATGRFAWDTGGKLGARDVWVNVDHRAIDEDLYTDNWAHRTINLAPHRQYLPLAFKDS